VLERSARREKRDLLDILVFIHLTFGTVFQASSVTFDPRRCLCAPGNQLSLHGIRGISIVVPDACFTGHAPTKLKHLVFFNSRSAFHAR
jgi:hypothetical protein